MAYKDAWCTRCRKRVHLFASQTVTSFVYCRRCKRASGLERVATRWTVEWYAVGFAAKCAAVKAAQAKT